MYTAEQLKRRAASPWTRVVSILAPLQFMAFVVSFYLVLRFLMLNEGYMTATVSVLIKIGLLWAITAAGILWEKDMYDHYFMAREFFWEDFGNLVAMLTHNAYFVVKWIGWEPRETMLVMCFAYVTYLFNFGQFMVKWYKSLQQRRAAR